jgi:hypothetical protein
MLAEYDRDGNESTMEVLSNIYVNEYMPEIRNLRMLHYEIMEMNSPEEDMQQLFQRDVALERDDLVSGEAPRVVAFKTTIL